MTWTLLLPKRGSQWYLFDEKSSIYAGSISETDVKNISGVAIRVIVGVGEDVAVGVDVRVAVPVGDGNK